MDLSFLRGVAKPTRYTGGEVNEVVKEDRPDLLHVALAFPDTYDIGMSYLGLQILYRALNSREKIWAERAFMPMPDMEEALVSRGLPLYALESKRPLSAFHLIGFSLVFELSYTNVLHMLRLGGVPARASERGEGHPLVLAGGPCAVNPEPLAEFVDAFFLGEAEEGFLEICDAVRANLGRPRAELLRALARVPGVYVPSLYRTETAPASGATVVAGPAEEGVPYPVVRRALWDLDAHPFPSDLVVPHHEVVHDRLSVEIARGCSAGCRFCQAGYTYRPYRERSGGSILKSVRGGIDATGFNEVTLLSLNAGEFGGIEALSREVARGGASQRLGVAMPSLRASSVTPELVSSLSSGRKSGFTVAPEAGTQRLRDVVNKNITEEDLLGAASAVFSSGWNLVKLYFMLGLPTETDEDVDAIARLAEGVVGAARRAGNRRAQVNLSTSSFIPKPFTPFQWRPMERPSELLEKQARLKRLLRRPVAYKWHDVRATTVEAALCLGDRRVGRAVARAAELGCRLDAWSEHFRYDLWQKAFADSGLDLEALACRERGRDERLPWDHLDMGVRKEFLWREWERAQRGETTPACGPGACTGCAEFAKRCIAGEFERREQEAGSREQRGNSNPPCPPSQRGEEDGTSSSVASPLSSSPSSPHHPIPSSPEHGDKGQETGDQRRPPSAGPIPSSPLKYRMRYRKDGPAAFLGHLDLVDVLVRALRRAGTPLAYSQGYHPMPKVEPAAPLSLGVEGRAEWMDLTLTEGPSRGILSRLNGLLPRGLRAEEIAPLRPSAPPLSAFTLQSYQIGLGDLAEAERADLSEHVAAFLAAPSWTVTRGAKVGSKTVDLRPRVSRLEVHGDVLALELKQGGFMDLLEVLFPGPERGRLRLVRTALSPPPEALPPQGRRLQSLADAFESGVRRP